MPAKLAELEADFGVDLILRSTTWLSVKESRSSFLIEREQDQEERIRRFAGVMENECGQHGNPFTPASLSLLQRGVLGERALRYGLRLVVVGDMRCFKKHKITRCVSPNYFSDPIIGKMALNTVFIPTLTLMRCWLGAIPTSPRTLNTSSKSSTRR